MDQMYLYHWQWGQWTQDGNTVGWLTGWLLFLCDEEVKEKLVGGAVSLQMAWSGGRGVKAVPGGSRADSTSLLTSQWVARLNAPWRRERDVSVEPPAICLINVHLKMNRQLKDKTWVFKDQWSCPGTSLQGMGPSFGLFLGVEPT